MRTNCERHANCIGVDLTDAHCRRVRPIDVCGLDVNGSTLTARFWQWTYEGGLDDVGPLLLEIGDAKGVILDGPQALATRGETVRECERILGAPGRTPDTPPREGPFSGFVRTSVELFAAFRRAGVPVSPEGLAGAVAEQYPGGNWSRLVCTLPSKKIPPGIAARRVILQALGIRLPDAVLTDDHLDACLGAVIAAAANNLVNGAHVERVGTKLSIDGPVLREGPILLLALDDETKARIRPLLTNYVAPSKPRNSITPTGVGTPNAGKTRAMRIRVTEEMLAADTRCIAVAGLADLEAGRESPRKVRLVNDDGYLWLGDHTALWERHQSNDSQALETFVRLRQALANAPHDFDELDVEIE